MGMAEDLVLTSMDGWSETVGVKLFPARKQRASVKAAGQVQTGWQPRVGEVEHRPLL